MLRFGKNIDMETSSYSVSKCKLVSGGGAGPYQSGHRTGAILWVESTTKQCSRNATCRQWVMILVSLDEYTFPNQVFMISSRDASMLPPNDVCQDTSISFKTMYCLTMPAYVHLPMSTRQCPEPRHPCACPLTNEYQTTSRSYKVQFILAVPAYTHQTTSTKQRLPSNART